MLIDNGWRPRKAKRMRAANDSGPRRPGAVRHIVLHSTEGGTAASVASYFARQSTRASTHLVIDDDDTYICVPDLVIPWGAPGVNASGLHIEHCGFARWDSAEWLKHRAMIDQSARRAALWAWQFDVPLVLLSPDQLKAGAAGFVTHATASKAFSTSGGHTDPGAGFPTGLYMHSVRTYLNRIEADRART